MNISTIKAILMFILSLSVLSACSRIEIEKTDISALEVGQPSTSAPDALGKPVFVFSDSQYQIDYYEIDKGYFKPQTPTRRDEEIKGCFYPLLGQLACGIWGAVELAKAVKKTNEAKKAQRGGLAIIRSPSGQILNVLSTEAFAQEEPALNTVAQVYSAAKSDAPAALTLIGGAEVNDSRRHALFSEASRKGNTAAREALAGGIVLERFPSTDLKAEPVRLFALEHPEYALCQLRFLAEPNSVGWGVSGDDAAHKELEAPSFGKFTADSGLFDLGELHLLRSTIAREFRVRLSQLTVEERSWLEGRLRVRYPDEPDCQLWAKAIQEAPAMERRERMLRLAQQGDAKAMEDVARMYVTLVPIDYVRAYKWWTIAEICGREGQVIRRDRFLSKMSADEIAEAERLVTEWRSEGNECAGNIDDTGGAYQG